MVINTNSTGAGSLHQAILDANANTGADVINFNLPSGGLTIAPASALPSIFDPVTIDGSTQPGFSGAPVIEINGASAGTGVDGFKIATSNSVIRALVINRFLGDGIEITNGSNNRVEGCYVGLNVGGLTDLGNTLNGIYLTNAANNIIGGLAGSNRNFIAGNTQSGIHLGGASTTNNVLLGNYVGLNVTNGAVANSADGVRVNAPFSIIGGSATRARNYISGNSGQGIEITAQGVGTIVCGNYIGTDDTGTLDRGNNTDGIINSAGGVFIGGANPGEGNLISGNNGDGIELSGTAATNISVLGNIIGANFSGTAAVRNTGNGIVIASNSRSNIIGGILAGQANHIAFNGSDGISIAAGNGNTNSSFRGNAIYSNGDLGIDLGATGTTANDGGDVDLGANQLQNFPVLTAVTNTPAGTIVVGSLSSSPATTYAVDFYSSLDGDPTGIGEGQTYLGSASLTTDGAGLNSFSVSLPVPTVPGRYISATATDNYGNTSEFSTNVLAVSTVPGQTLSVVNTNDSGPGSLRQSIVDANATISAGDTIQFAITNLSTTITPASALPTITDPVTIDGYSQPGSAINPSAATFNGVVPVHLSGTAAGSGANGLLITAGNSTVRGLMITGFSGDGIEISGLGGNIIAGNVIGLDATGAIRGNSGNGVLISGSSNNVVGGATLAARNVIGGNAGEGVEINGALARNNRVSNNLIGTEQTGGLDRGNKSGVLIVNAPDNTIGGADPGEGNLLSGSDGYGVELSGLSAVNNFVQGNRIGMTATGTPLRNDIHGVFITSNSRSNIIGGVLPGQGNRIAFNGSRGIMVGDPQSTNNVLRGNAIFANGILGIDLNPAGVALNDTNDVDTGANQLQNFPILTAVSTNLPLAQINIAGSLASAATTAYLVDLYVNSGLESTGYGEGESYLGTTSIMTDASGNAAFSLTLPGILPGRYVSATATDPFGNTSEFSRWAVALNAIPSTNVTLRAADFVFIIDASSSMSGEISAVKNGLSSFVAGLNTAQIDARFAVVLFGGPPELVLDFTTDQGLAEAAFDLISVNGELPGVQENHNLNPEAGLEAIRVALNAAATNGLVRDHVGGSGPLSFRPDARKNLILVTDEDSDQPFYVENRQPGQTNLQPSNPIGEAWQAEVDATAQAVITNSAFVNLLFSPNAITRNQYGDPNQSVSDSNFLNYNPEATLANLNAAGFGNSLEAQVLKAGLVGRAFNIASVDTTNFIANFFAAKVEEIVSHPILPPRLNIAALPHAVRLSWTTNAPGFLLETNYSLIRSNNWGVLTTNYSIIGTNYAVTNTTIQLLRYYRLRK
jgi:hypothetical protein